MKRRAPRPKFLTSCSDETCRTQVVTVAFGRGTIPQMLSPQPNKRGETIMTTKTPNVTVSNNEALLKLTLILKG